MEKQTGTSDQRILPGMAKWTSCRNDSVKNGGMRLELNTQEFGGARQKPCSFKGLPEGGIRKLLHQDGESYRDRLCNYQSRSAL
jgi:hypothetical protein